MTKLLAITSYADVPYVVKILVLYVLAGLCVGVLMSVYKEIVWLITKKDTNKYVNQIVAFSLSIVILILFKFTPFSISDSYLLYILTSPVVYIIQRTIDLGMITKIIKMFVAKGLKSAGATDKDISSLEDTTDEK